MTSMQSAAGADQKQTWSASLRISEVAPPESPHLPPHGMTRELIPRQIALRFLAGWKWFESKRAQQLASRRLRVAETISLGEKRSVSIVQVDGSQYLIGCSSGSVQLLAVLNGQETAATRPVESKATS